MISGLLKFLGINSSDSDITKEPKMKSEENGTGSNITKIFQVYTLTNSENMLMKKGMCYPHQRWMQYGIKTITRTIIIDRNY